MFSQMFSGLFNGSNGKPELCLKNAKRLDGTNTPVLSRYTEIRWTKKSLQAFTTITHDATSPQLVLAMSRNTDKKWSITLSSLCGDINNAVVVETQHETDNECVTLNSLHWHKVLWVFDQIVRCLVGGYSESRVSAKWYDFNEIDNGWQYNMSLDNSMVMAKTDDHTTPWTKDGFLDIHVLYARNPDRKRVDCLGIRLCHQGQWWILGADMGALCKTVIENASEIGLDLNGQKEKAVKLLSNGDTLIVEPEAPNSNN